MRWCCNTFCGPLPWLAVGGDPIQESDHCGANIELYVFDSRTNCLEGFAYQQQPDKVFALEWLSSCKCSHLVVGSGCIDHGCWIPNIIIYQVTKHDKFELIPKLHTRFDDNITSLSSCKIGEITFIIAGAESNTFGRTPIDPWCFECPTKELALIKGKFCLDQEPPRSICCRTIKQMFSDSQFLDPLTSITLGADNENL